MEREMKEPLTYQQIEQHRREAEYEKGNSHRAKVIVKLCDHIADLRARLDAAEQIIRGLSRGLCWCDVAIGNPMVRDHSPACKEAQRLMAKS